MHHTLSRELNPGANGIGSSFDKPTAAVVSRIDGIKKSRDFVGFRSSKSFLYYLTCSSFSLMNTRSLGLVIRYCGTILHITTYLQLAVKLL
jgi:hypothetical protein